MGARRWSTTVASLVLVSVAAAGCGTPPPGPGPEPAWVGTRLGRDAGPPIVNRLGGWSDEDWFATVEVTSGTPTSTELVVYPRTGADGEQLGEPQRLDVAPSGLAAPMGDGLIGMPSGGGVAFFTESGGVWSAAGWHPVPEGHRLAALDRDWMVLTSIPGYAVGAPGEVRVHPLDTSGPEVQVGSPQLLGPDPTWPATLREGFGHLTSLSGTLLSVSGIAISEPGPGGLRVFRLDAGTWAPEASLGGTPTTPSGFARAHDVHDGTAVDRLALAPSLASPSDMDVEVWSDSTGTWSLEREIERDGSLEDLSGGLWFGSALSLDEDRLALVARSVEVDSADPTHDPVEVGHVQIHRLTGGSGSVVEAELSPFVVPYDPGTRRAAPLRLDLTGDHLGVDVLITLDEPPGCIFPCLSVLGFEAWSYTRT